MKELKIKPLGCIIFLLSLYSSCHQGNGDYPEAQGQDSLFFEDKHTVLLWLFDEEAYPNATITDASPYEVADLRLTSSSLAQGKFGNALSSQKGYNVIYAGFSGRGALVPRQPDGVPTGLWGPTYAPENLLRALAGSSLTFEFWLKPSDVLPEEAFLLDLGRGLDAGFSLLFVDEGKTLEVRNHYRGIKTIFEWKEAFAKMNDFTHLAIQIDSEGKGSVFLDGRFTVEGISSTLKKSPLPPIESPRENFNADRNWADLSEEQKLLQRFNVSLLQSRKAESDLPGVLDEFRVSDILRFGRDGFQPKTYSRNYSDAAYSLPTPTGPPLLFSNETKDVSVFNFGKRKHLFLDDRLLETLENAQIVMKPWKLKDAEKTDIEKVDGEWRITFVQDGERKLGIATANYNSSLGLVYLYETRDGLKFDGKPVEMVNYPMGGDLFIDDSPEAHRDGTRFKLTAYLSGRGIYLYTSPDAFHWRRNETAMFPLLSGGSAESFYDDQRAKYVTYLKRDASFDNPEAVNPQKRVSVRFETEDPYRVWPFKKMKEPYFEYSPFPVVTGEGESQFILPHGAPSYEQVYRTRVVKYPYAPDTYLAFPWIYLADSDDRNVAIAHSRDGDEWNIITETYYVDKGKYTEVISCQGLHREGDELWHYLEVGDAHGRGERTWYRIRIRLDGYFALQSDEVAGSSTTKTLQVAGDQLRLNYIAKKGGSVFVEVLEESGSVVPGFSKGECAPLTGDEISARVKWQDADFNQLSGRTIRLKFYLQNAEVYSIETL
ncbi:hypothetical protein [Pleomorphovibrio marinus]|uniref:hypothetical protein n=1 Tax=Pleomorphovibrio marinus TaxID=2164132 RepID=UPI000E0B4CEE|nr:hypothetical protein [Pleomorphovibrio marinus]